MNELNLLLRSVIENPDDDLVRLAYADALDELPTKTVPCTNKAPVGPHWGCPTCNGTGTVTDTTNRDRAEFVRVQVGCSRWSEDEALRDVTVDWNDKGKLERTLLTENCDRFRALLPSSQPYCHSWSFYLERHADETNDDYTASFDRGFLHTVTCGAEWFLAHADELVWHPTQTVECGSCAGWTKKHNLPPYNYCSLCVNGRVPRPCPDTAQPVRKVVLTTVPDLCDEMYNLAKKHRYDWLPTEAGPGGHTQRRFAFEILSKEWPGIEFELPSSTGVTNFYDINDVLHQIQGTSEFESWAGSAEEPLP